MLFGLGVVRLEYCSVWILFNLDVVEREREREADMGAIPGIYVPSSEKICM